MVNTFKDILTIRKYEMPFLEVCDPAIKSSATGKHHVYKIKGRDYNGPVEIFRRYRNFY